MNESLPVTLFREQIIAAVRKHPAVIITAETGAGKSTQVPQFLLAEDYNIVVTQPRRLAARTVAARVAHEYGEELGQTIGFRTAYERRDSQRTRCLFCTDGLALVRELMGAGAHNVLVLDEVHEWNLNIEVLVAWAKRQIEQGANFKVVVMSATLEAEKLSEFFGGAPVIDVPGRLFPVTEKEPGPDQLSDVRSLLRRGHNVIWFQPGKSEIAKAIVDLTARGDLSAEILPLHGELDSAEQDRCFRQYNKPKCVVSTNVAQTSVTIDDIDAVVDCGVERRVELEDGVEGLYLKPISLVDAKQRKGRAGRTRPGIYIDWCPSMDRLDFPKAEILRSRLDQTVLRLAEAGINMEELRFFHQPDLNEIHEARRALVALGCMDKDGQVTRIGQRVAKLPVSVQFGRMVIEAERLGVVDDVVTVAAILEQGEITARKIRKGEHDYDAMSTWRGRFCPDESTSDILAQLAVYNGARSMPAEALRDAGVSVKAYFQAKEKRRHLADALRGKVRSFTSTGNREDILRAVCAGMVDHLWKYSYGEYQNGDGQSRQLARESVVQYARGAEWVVGLPFDLQVKTRRRGLITLRLVRMATKVDLAWLVDVAPHLLEKKEGINPCYDSMRNEVVSTTQFLFNGQSIWEETVTITDLSNPIAVQARIDYLYKSFVPPTLPLVNMNDEQGIIPPLRVCVVGTHPETGEPLKFYGTYRATWYGSVDQWTRDGNEATGLRNKFIDDVQKRHDENHRIRLENERYRTTGYVGNRIDTLRVRSEVATPALRPSTVTTVERTGQRNVPSNRGTEKVEVAKVDLSQLFGGNATLRKK